MYKGPLTKRQWDLINHPDWATCDTFDSNDDDNYDSNNDGASNTASNPAAKIARIDIINLVKLLKKIEYKPYSFVKENLIYDIYPS